MIKNGRLLAEFEREFIKKNRLDYLSNLRLYEAMYEEARTLGVLPGENPLTGMEWKIRFVRMLNSL